MVTIDQIEKGVVQYAQNELLPHMEETGIQRFLVGMTMGRFIKAWRVKLEKMMEDDFVKSLGYFDEEGKVDLDALRDECKAQMSDKGIVIEHWLIDKMTFEKSDVDVLYKYIMNQEG